MVAKLIAVDLNGTSLNSDNAISPETLRTLQVAHGMGTKVVLASGCPLPGVMSFENQLGLEGSEEYAVVSGGVVAQDLSGKVLVGQEMGYRNFEVVLRLQCLTHVDLHLKTTERFWALDHDLLIQMQINTALTGNKIRVCERKEIPRDFAFNKVGFTRPGDSDQTKKLRNSIPHWTSEFYDVVRSSDNCIELNGTGASKGNALMNLTKQLKISLENVVVFGDQGNGVSMFENPNFKKIVTGNVVKDIKEKAGLTTNGNDHNDIIKALKKFVI